MTCIGSFSFSIHLRYLVINVHNNVNKPLTTSDSNYKLAVGAKYELLQFLLIGHRLLTSHSAVRL